jgi:hypothetical protein
LFTLDDVDFCEGEEAGEEEDGVIAAQLVLLLGDELVELVVRFLREGWDTVSWPWSILFLVSLTISARRAF